MIIIIIGSMQVVLNCYFATQVWAVQMLDSQKLVGSGPVQPVWWLRLCSRQPIKDEWNGPCFNLLLITCERWKIKKVYYFVPGFKNIINVITGIPEFIMLYWTKQPKWNTWKQNHYFYPNLQVIRYVKSMTSRVTNYNTTPNSNESEQIFPNPNDVQDKYSLSRMKHRWSGTYIWINCNVDWFQEIMAYQLKLETCMGALLLHVRGNMAMLPYIVREKHYNFSLAVNIA